MPYLLDIPESTPAEIFDTRERPLPQPSLPARAAMKALHVPFINRTGLVQRALCRALSVPETTQFRAGFVSRGGRLHCGRHVTLTDTVFFDYAPVFIDEHVTFTFRNLIITSTHDLRDFRRVIARPVILEKNVWITANVVILGGVRIGRNTVVGAGSVVTCDLPPNVLAAGNPCRPIRAIERDVEMRDSALSARQFEPATFR